MNRNDVYNKVQAALRNGGLVRPDFCARNDAWYENLPWRGLTRGEYLEGTI